MALPRMRAPFATKPSVSALLHRKAASRSSARRPRQFAPQALFSRSASGGAGNEQVAELVSVAKQFRNPSEAGNEALSDLRASLSKLNKKNPRSSAINGKWNILYASGQSGLTALPGQIASFTVTSDGYENQCNTRTLGVFGGYAKEGGKIKVTGGDSFELLQEYLEFKNGPGAAMEEESEDAAVRTFQVIYLDDDVLFMRLKATRYRDENGRMQNVTPDDDYYLVWQKDGASTPRISRAAVQEDDEEEEEAESSPSPLFGLGTAVLGRKQTSLATITERNLGEGGTTTLDRKAAAREEAAERRRQQQEAAEARRREREEQRQAKAQASRDEEGPKKGGVFGLFGGKKDEEEEEEEEAQPRGFGSLFTRKEEKPEEVEEEKGGLFSMFGKKEKEEAPAPSCAGSQRVDPAQRRQQKAQEAEDRKRAAAEAAEARRQEAEERKRAAAEAAEERRREAEERKAQQARLKEEAEAARQSEREQRQAINDAIATFQEQGRETAATIRDLSGQLRSAQQESKDIIRKGEAAQRQLEQVEAVFKNCEDQLDTANDAYNQVAAQLRETNGELQAAQKEVAQLEKALI